MGPQQVVPPQARIDLGVMKLEEYSTLLKYSEVEPHHQMQFSVMPRTPFFVREWVNSPQGIQ